MRFHSLPESKRYAETDRERDILLSRHNVLAAKVLGEGPCWLVQTHWTAPDSADAHDPFRATREHRLEFAFAFDVSEGDEKDIRWNVHAVETRWAPGKFDDLLWEIANERAGPTIWMSSADGAIFAPYDGGVDLFLTDAETVHSLTSDYAAWRSSYHLGM